jgi:hypothetical protein
VQKKRAVLFLSLPRLIIVYLPFIFFLAVLQLGHEQYTTLSSLTPAILIPYQASAA